MFTGQDLESLAIEISINKNFQSEDYEKYRRDIRNYFGDDRAFEPFKSSSIFYRGDLRLNGEPDIHFARCAIIVREAGGLIDSCIGAMLHDRLEDQFKKDFKEYQRVNTEIDKITYITKDQYSRKDYNKIIKDLNENKKKLIKNIFNVYDKNDTLLEIENMFKQFGLEKTYVEQIKLLSYIYSLPKERRDMFERENFKIDYEENSYRKYVENIVDWVLDKQILGKGNQGPLHAKLADRTDNSKTLRNIDNSKVEKAVKKNLILLNVLENRVYDGLKIGNDIYKLQLDDTTKRLIHGLRDVLSRERRTDYAQIQETLEWRNHLNSMADEFSDRCRKLAN